jgi:hypothetical protein
VSYVTEKKKQSGNAKKNLRSFGVEPKLVLGLDPGKTTGVAQIKVVGNKIELVYSSFTVTKDETLLDIEHLFEESDFIVVEDFKTRPGDARRGAFDWNQMIAPQVIGSAKALAKRYSKPLVLQQASQKPIGYGLANMKYVPGKKGTHSQDALCHAVLYAVRSLGANPVTA